MSLGKEKRNEHALVVGGSMAGLLAARVLSDHFDHVTIVERDAVHDHPESRKAQPQTRHLHAVLESGFRIFSQLFPELEKTLIEEGAIVRDFGKAARWYQFGNYKIQEHSGHRLLLVSRPLLEWRIRRCVLERPNVSIISSCSAEDPLLSADGQTLTGMKIRKREDANLSQTISADLIVDACGRGSPTPIWLKRLGFEPPPEREVKVRVGYATRLYQRCPDLLKGAEILMISSTPPVGKRMTYLFPIEDDRWIVTAGGWNGDYPPGEEQGLLEFIKSLPVPDMFHVVSNAQPLSDIVTHRFPSSLRRHYEKLKRFPNGYLVIGDAVASFNPVYGQGMSSAAMQAQILGEVVGQEFSRDNWRAYFRRIAEVVDLPWQLAVGEDFRYPETEGEKLPTVDLINRYVAMIHRASHRDPIVYRQFLNVSNLLAQPTSLMHPRIVWRVLCDRLRN